MARPHLGAIDRFLSLELQLVAPAGYAAIAGCLGAGPPNTTLIRKRNRPVNATNQQLLAANSRTTFWHCLVIGQGE